MKERDTNSREVSILDRIHISHPVQRRVPEILLISDLLECNQMLMLYIMKQGVTEEERTKMKRNRTRESTKKQEGLYLIASKDVKVDTLSTHGRHSKRD